MKKTIPLFMKNIESIRDITKLSQENFCGRILDWADLDKQCNNAWDDLSVYKPKIGANGQKVCINVLTISENTYTNYLNGKTSPTESGFFQILCDLNEIRKRHPILKKCFREDITLEQLQHHDLLKEFNDENTRSNSLFTEKFFGTYLCYYNSTSIDDDDRKTQFGILQLNKGSNDNEFIANGIFSFKNENQAQEIFNSLLEGCTIQEATEGLSSLAIFSGLAYLSPTLLWCNLSDSAKGEHVSMSFDLSSKITTKHPEKNFVGSRGIALSQTSGQSNQTATFPIVIICEPLSVSLNELTNYLHFNYSKIPEDKLAVLATRAVRLMTSLLQNNDINEDLRLSLISQIVEHEVKDLLKKHIFNSHYYTPKEMTDFYGTIIRPIRRGTKIEDND